MRNIFVAEICNGAGYDDYDRTFMVIIAEDADEGKKLIEDSLKNSLYFSDGYVTYIWPLGEKLAMDMEWIFSDEPDEEYL